MKNNDFIWGTLLHLGMNMWDDNQVPWERMPDTPAAAEKANLMGPTKASRIRNYVRCDEAVWKDATAEVKSTGGNMVVIDLGEACFYPSHPELAVKGTWSTEKMRAEIARLRKLGLEPIPKLNFSTCHDSWLKDYHRMISTPEYYRVCQDVINDVCDLFGNPRFFHLGFDEEMAIAQFNTGLCVCRQGDLWWHDFLKMVGFVERRGVRAMIWSDYIWTNKALFLKRMPKTVLQCNWYYRDDFSAKKLVWNDAFEKKGGWGETVHGAVSFLELEKAGYDQLPCCSNWACDTCADALVGFCKNHIAPERLKGFMTAPWCATLPDKRDKLLAGIRQLGEARKKYYL